MISQYQFSVLRALLSNPQLTQRDLVEKCAISLGSVNKTLHELHAFHFIDDDGVTEAGAAVLEPYRVHNAVVLAAGGGSRFAPLSFEKPKAMFEVRGEVLIERLIGQMREAGIRNISIVVGYMKESFFYLGEKFDVDIIVNPDYATRGNYSSLYAARHVAEKGSYVCSSDQYYSSNPFESYEFGSVLYLDRKASRSNDLSICWNSRGRVVSIARDKGDEWCMRGPTYMDSAAASHLIDVIELEYDDSNGRLCYWDDVYARHKEEFDFHVALLPRGILHEFNFMSDLCAFDADFLSNVDSTILDNICSTLNCNRREIMCVRPVKAGLTNLSVLFTCRGSRYVYRHPGAGTDEIINRESEAYSLGIAKKLGLDDSFVYEDPETGWKLSRYISGCVDFDYQSEDHVSRALDLMRTLHHSGEVSPWHFDFYEEACKIEKLLKGAGYPLPNDFDSFSAQIGQLASYVRADAGDPVLCHNDFYGPNLLVKDDAMYLIDWEYSAMGDYAGDIGNFIAQDSGYTVDDAMRVVERYFARKPTEEELLHCLGCTAVVGYYWYVWAIYKESQGNAMSEWIYSWYRTAKEFSAYILPLYREREALMRPLSKEEFDNLVNKESEGLASREDLRRLEKYRVKRAVFFAAGFGSRMLPITVNTPKPLVRVHGVRIIDRLLDAVLNVGIEEIYIVRGYLADEFDQLLSKYPMIRFIDNPLYSETNNISSALVAKDYLQDAYVFESDLYLANPSLVTKYQYRSNYLGMFVEATDDWYFDIDESGRITNLAKGKDAPCWQMAGLSFWTKDDGLKLAQDVEAVFEENDENKQIFWDDIALRCRADSYDVYVRSFNSEDIVEIDSFAELQEIDSSYRVQ